ncbi:MAG: exo-alpha-sialidase [Bacteroidota bacterium]
MKKLLLLSFLATTFLLTDTDARAQVAPQGKFIRFNGIDQYMSIRNHSDLNIAIGESFTICFRLNPDNLSDQYRIVSKGNAYISGGRFEFNTYSSSVTPNFNFDLRNFHNTNLGATCIKKLEAGKWAHVAWVYNTSDKSSKVFIDGQLLSSVYHYEIGTQTVANLYDLMVGCGWTDAMYPVKYDYWPGQFDELRIWKRALTSGQVLADCSAATPDTTSLVAAYNFERIAGTSIPDISGKGHNGQIFNFGIRVVKTSLPVGIGEKNERLVGFRIMPDSASRKVSSISIDLSETEVLSDISDLKVYYNGPSERLDLKTAILFGSSSSPVRKRTITGSVGLIPGDNYFWITADINPRAREGNRIGASVSGYITETGNRVAVPAVVGKRTILLASKLLFSGGDGGSKYYRIPAIVKARDGSLITATDKRWDYPYDLPCHIDVVIRRSTDDGQTWSDPVTIAGEGTEVGFGDPALVLNRKNGEVICLCASDKGYFHSTAYFPIRIYQVKSTDNGITWSVPQDITTQIYGSESSDPVTKNWQAAFVSSGSATQLSSGRLMASIPVRESSSRDISNFVIYSDDDAQTWQVSTYCAAVDGNEAKLVELDNGYVLMSIRNYGTRKFSISKDHGMTWSTPFAQHEILDPFCNGDLIRYTALSDGYNRNRLLHSIPYSDCRENVTVLLSYSEGETWPIRKTVCSGASAYSSLAVLNDGTIGMYYEVGEYEIYQMYFVRFSLDWLSDGTDTWSDVDKTSVGLAENRSSIIVYPNPADKVLNIKGSFEPGTRIELYNSQGILMNQNLVYNYRDHVEFSLEGFPSGVYFLKTGDTITKVLIKRSDFPPV